MVTTARRCHAALRVARETTETSVELHFTYHFEVDIRMSVVSLELDSIKPYDLSTRLYHVFMTDAQWRCAKIGYMTDAQNRVQSANTRATEL